MNDQEMNVAAWVVFRNGEEIAFDDVGDAQDWAEENGGAVVPVVEMSWNDIFSALDLDD